MLTPNQRRRTQIRLAQRTYRARKETTIAELEDQVAGLQKVIHTQNVNVRNMYQLAVKSNLARSSPDFFQAFSNLMQDFDVSLKTSPVDLPCQVSGPSAPSAHGPTQDSVASSQHLTPPASLPSDESSIEEMIEPDATSMPPTNSIMAPNIVSTELRGAPSVLGYEMVYNEADSVSPTDPNYAYPLYPDQNQVAASYGPLQQHQQHQPMQSQQQQFSTAAHRSLQHSQSFQAHMPMHNELMPAVTYAYHEGTFTRYFHRRCLEYAVLLLSQPNKYQNTIKVVFAHSLANSPMNDIWERLRARLSLTMTENLDAPIPYQQPADWDEHGRWFRPAEIEEFFLRKGMKVHPQSQIAEYETEDNENGPSNTSHDQPAHAQMSSQLMVPPAPPYQGMYGPAPFPKMGPNPNMSQWVQQYNSAAAWSGPGRRRKRVTVNVQELLENLTRSARCHGRQPAVREQDVNSAFHRSVLGVAAC